MDNIIKHVKINEYRNEPSTYMAITQDGTTLVADYKLHADGDVCMSIHHMVGDEKLLPYYWAHKHVLDQQIDDFIKQQSGIPFVNEYEVDVDFNITHKSYHDEQGFFVNIQKNNINRDNTITITLVEDYFVTVEDVYYAQESGKPLVFESEGNNPDFVIEAEDFLRAFVESNDPEVVRRAIMAYETKESAEEMMEELARPNEQMQTQRMVSNHQFQQQLRELAALPPEARAAALGLVSPQKQAIIGQMLMMNMTPTPEVQVPVVQHEPERQDDNDYQR